MLTMNETFKESLSMEILVDPSLGKSQDTHWNLNVQSIVLLTVNWIQVIGPLVHCSSERNPTIAELRGMLMCISKIL